MNDLAKGSVEQEPLRPRTARSDANDFEELAAELRDLQMETAQLEIEIRERTAELLGKFDASFPLLKVVDIVNILPSELEGWLLAGEA